MNTNALRFRLLRMATGVSVVVLTLASHVAHAATVWVHVPNMSQLQYQTYPDGKVYLRNLSTFDSQVAPGNYTFYIDTTTMEGKNIYALVLSAMAQGSSLYLGLPNGYTATGPVSTVGAW